MISVYLMIIGVVGLFGLAFWQDFSYQRKQKQYRELARVKKNDPEDQKLHDILG